MRYSIKNAGFTLIEMIVVISIMTILTIVILAGYSSYRQRNNLKIAAQELRSALTEAQNMALAPRFPATGYLVKINKASGTSQGSYQVKYYTGTYYPPESTNYTSSEVVGALRMPPKNVKIENFSSGGNPIPSPIELIFTTPFELPGKPKKTCLNYDTTNTCTGEVKIKLTQGSNSRYVKINLTSGEISLE